MDIYDQVVSSFALLSFYSEKFVSGSDKKTDICELKMTEAGCSTPIELIVSVTQQKDSSGL